MMDYYFILDEAGEPVPCSDAAAWAQWFMDHDRKVARTEVGELVVSTVFLGYNSEPCREGPPMLFETMIFACGTNGRALDFRGALDFQVRYPTRDAAIAGHRDAVALAAIPRAT